MAGRKKRRQNLPEGEEQSRKAARDESAALPKSGGKPVYNDRDEPAALPSVLKPRANLGETRS